MLEVEKVLKEKGADYRIIELKGRAMTVQDVVEMSKGDIKPEEICKTIILKDKKGLIGLVLKGSDRIDFDKLRKETNRDFRITQISEVKALTGLEPGAVCPILLKIPIFVDQSVLGLKRINFGSGNHMFGLEIATEDLKKLVDFRTVDVV